MSNEEFRIFIEIALVLVSFGIGRFTVDTPIAIFAKMGVIFGLVATLIVMGSASQYMG